MNHVCNRGFLFFLVALMCVHYCLDAAHAEALAFRNVVPDINAIESRGDYAIGRQLFKRYQQYGMPEDFGISIKPGLVIAENDIKQIVVNEQIVVEHNRIAVPVAFLIEEDYEFMISAFTTLSMGSVVALDIGGVVFNVSRITKVLSGSVLVDIINMETEEVVSILSRLNCPITLRGL